MIPEDGAVEEGKKIEASITLKLEIPRTLKLEYTTAMSSVGGPIY